MARRVVIPQHRRAGKVIKRFTRRKRTPGRKPFKTTILPRREVRRDRSGLFT